MDSDLIGENGEHLSRPHLHCADSCREKDHRQKQGSKYCKRYRAGAAAERKGEGEKACHRSHGVFSLEEG